MTLVEQKLAEAYTILVLAKKRTLSEVPENVRAEVEIRVAERTVEVLGNE